jgi:hypothetical protein
MVMRNKVLAIASWWLPVLLAGLGCKGDNGDKVGQACDLTVGAGPNQAVVNFQAGACSSGVCLKPVQDPASASQYQDPPTGATCTAECSSDSDCDGELRNPNDPQDTRCAKGFTCAVPFVVGPLCCKKYCLCKDFLPNTGLPTPLACEGPDALATCQSAAGSASAAGVGQQTDLYITGAPIRKLDLVFMIDNSAMAPKLEKMNAQLPTLLKALKDPGDGIYPDLRVAMIDSDLGTGGQYTSGSCGPNDSNKMSPYGDFGNFQMRGASGCGVTGDALWLEYTKGQPVNYRNPANGDISQVFGCLATNLGIAGCGFEHQLQAFEFALVAKSTDNLIGRSPVQDAFLRPTAYLGLVILSDEDDCSAAPNDGMFGDANHPELKGESASLRCATRAHKCNGVNVNTAPPAGAGYPTTAPFIADFSTCSARIDACPNSTDGTGSTDTTGNTQCSPLKSISHMAQEIKDLKGDQASEKVLVAGIFGWPRNGPDGKPDFADAQYKIDLVPNPNPQDTAHPKVYDYWPVCYDPSHIPPADGSFNQDAWGWSAQGGLRISAFIDEFGTNGLKYSICEPDFSAAMKGIGDAIAKRLQYLCVDAKLMDVDPVSPGLQPDCRVVYRTPRTTSGSQIIYEESAPLPICPPGATPETVASDCWQLAYDLAKCPGTGQLITIVRTAAEIAAGPLTEGTKIGMNCWTCPDLVSAPGCQY